MKLINLIWFAVRGIATLADASIFAEMLGVNIVNIDLELSDLTNLSPQFS